MMELLVAAVLLLGNAVFVGGEFALIASRRTVIEPLAVTSKRARLALSAMNQVPLMIAGAQLGITICSLGLGAIAEPALAHLVAPLVHDVGLSPAGLGETGSQAFIATTVVLMVLTPFLTAAGAAGTSRTPG